MQRRSTSPIGIVILAAGGSSRMGTQKLLLEFAGQNMIQRCVSEALSSGIGDVSVVVGSDAPAIIASLAGFPVTIIENSEWERGQASSLVCGIAQNEERDACIVLVADQPFVTAQHLCALVRAYHSMPGDLFVSRVGTRRGNPALFTQRVFPELKALSGDEGARRIFSRHEVQEVLQDEPELFTDIDDRAAYDQACDIYYARQTDKSNYPLFFDREGENAQLCYLDSAATAQMPREVLAACLDYETSSRSNIHRGLYTLAEQSSEAYESARATIAAFFGADAENCILTHGATESLNMVAFGWGHQNLQKGDLVVIESGNHHSGIVPWQLLEQQIGIKVKFITSTPEGKIDVDSWRCLLEEKPKVVVLTHMSNVTGLVNDIATLSGQAHAAGAIVVVDCAQSAGHIPVSFSDLDIDFAAISAHKMGGPFGVGCLLVNSKRIAEMRPFMGGGGMIERVDEQGFHQAEGVAGFEAGTPNITGAIGFAAACDYLNRLGVDRLVAQGGRLCAFALEKLSECEGVRVLGGNDVQSRVSLFSFVMDGIHPHDIADELAQRGIAVRAGHHCAMPLHQALGIPASVRVSFAPYTTSNDILKLVSALHDIEGAYCGGR